MPGPNVHAWNEIIHKSPSHRRLARVSAEQQQRLRKATEQIAQHRANVRRLTAEKDELKHLLGIHAPQILARWLERKRALRTA